MKILRSIEDTRATVQAWHKKGETVALVPTMGYLHQGHLSLVKIAKENADHVLVSVFVNPTQFGPNEDFDKYPRDFEHDESLCNQAGVDGIFYPTKELTYAEDHSTWVQEENLSKTLCGVTRPIHFRGVATVCLKLFNITQCQVAVFGRKDAQQALIIARMVRDLNVPIKIIKAPLIREEDGLARSSRNKYLSKSEHQQALALSRAVFKAKKLFDAGERSSSVLLDAAHSEIDPSGGIIDYVEIMSQRALRPIATITEPALLAVAVKYGKTRLIDNVFLEV